MNEVPPVTEQIFRVWGEEANVSLEIHDCADNPDYLELVTPDKESAEWWGEVRLTFSPAYAKALGLALIRAAEAKL